MDEELRGEFAVIRTRLDAIEKVMVDFRGEVRGRLDGLETRLNGLETRLALKADAWMVSLWGGTLAGLIAVAAAIVTAVVVKWR
jgi:hypothetical protein